MSVEDQLSNNKTIKIYPNPVNKSLSIDSNFNILEFYDLKIFSLNTLLMYHSIKFEEKINVEKFAPGVYFLKILVDGSQIIKKIVVDR